MKWKNAGQVTRNQYANLNENGECSLSSHRTDIKIESAILFGGSPNGITPFSNAEIYRNKHEKKKIIEEEETNVLEWISFKKKTKWKENGDDGNKISYFHIPFQPI